MKKIVSLAAALALVASTAQAQSASDNSSPWTLSTTVSVTVPTILVLSLDDTTTAFAQPGEAEFDAGFQELASAITANVKANRGYTLNIQAGTALWGGTGSATKASTDLMWRLNAAAAPGNGLTTTAAAVAVETTGSPLAGRNYGLTYRILWSYANDTPGNYTLPVVFTATAP